MDSLERQQSSGSDATEPARSAPFAPGTTIARYRIVSFIGSGAMGDVYRAHDRALDREVALKVLPPELTGDRERVRRFAQEARAASALSHPHIVTIHEVGHARPTLSVRPIDQRATRRSEVHYIAMEYIEGRTLREALTESMPLRRSIELLAQVADGLGKAHAAGIIHRDLKPENILIAQDGYAKIVDFGLAKLIDASWNPIGADSPTLRALTAQGELLGTPGYMAPEQIMGKPLDARADVFSFGCILYETIARVRPFEADSFVDTLYRIVHEEPPPMATFVPEVAPELQRIVERCLAKDREGRYQSIRDAAHDLRSVASVGTPPLAVRSRAAAAPLFVLIAVTIAVLGFIFLRNSDPTPRTAQSVQRITSDGRAITAAISPDGRYAAYVTSSLEGQALWLEQIGSGTTLNVVPPKEAAHYVGITFSRDGEQLYFSRYDGDPIALLYRVSILGGEPRPVLRDIDTRAALSRDGTRLAFGRDDYNRGTSALMIANADGSGIRTLAQFRLPDRVTSPAWSPDGTNIIAAVRTKIMEISLDDGKQRVVQTATELTSFNGIAWPDERRIIASAATDDAAGRYRLWTIDLRSGKTSALTDDLTELLAPAVSDDGAIAALQPIRQANLFEVSREGAIKQLTSGIGVSNGTTGVAWMDGRVIYASSSEGKSDLWSLGNGEPRRLTDDAAFESQPTASPDGSALFYLSGGAIWRMTADGNDRRAITSGPRDGEFAISPDGRSIAFASLD